MTEVQNSGVSRRRIIQGAAWATPAIMIATAAPALAASTTPPSMVASSVSLGGATVSRASTTSTLAIKTLTVEILVNKTVQNGSNHYSLGVSNVTGPWSSVDVNQNGENRSQPAHSVYAVVTLQYSGAALTGTDFAQVAWTLTNAASIRSIRVSGTYGPASGSATGSFGPTTIY